MTKEWDSETTYKVGDEILLNGRSAKVLAVGHGGVITDLENVKPKNEGDTIRRWYQEADSDYDYRSQEDQDREFYGLEYIMRIGHKERGW